MSGHRGFSIPELIIVLAIVAVIFGIGTSVFVSARRQSGLNVLTDSIVAILERAKTDSMASKDGETFGVNFGTSSYTYFEGFSFNQAIATNVYSTGDYALAATTTPAGGTIIFARLSGTPSATSTITVTDPGNPSHSQVITVGSLGDINITR